MSFLTFIMIGLTVFLEPKKEKIDFDRLEYCFHDSSVPPEYHRSYTISISNEKVTKVVDSYGEIISTEEKKSNQKKFNEIKKLFFSSKIKNCSKKEKKVCTGGTGKSIFCYQEGEKVFSGTLYSCGGDEYGSLCGNMEKIKAALHRLLIE